MSETNRTQTPHAVIDDLIRGRSTGRVGLMESLWPETLVAWVQQGYPTRAIHKERGDLCWRREDGRWVDADIPGEYEEPVPPWEHFGYDLVGVDTWFESLPIRGYDELVQETDEWEVRRTGAGASFKFWKHKSGTPEHMDFLMSTRQVWERDYRPHLLRMDPLRASKVIKEAPANLKKVSEAGRWASFGHIFVWESARQCLGDITLYESLLMDPDWIHDFNRVYTDFYKLHFAYLFEQVGLPDGVWLYEDLGYKNGLFASPRTLEELIFPYYKEMVDFFHSYDLPVIFHSCGSTAQALPLILKAGFDAINPMERKARDNDPFTFAEKYGDRLAFIGGLDARVFETNDRDIIRTEVTNFLEGMKAREARLVFASDHSISPATHYASYQYALEVYREHMGY